MEQKPKDENKLAKPDSAVFRATFAQKQRKKRKKAHEVAE